MNLGLTVVQLVGGRQRASLACLLAFGLAMPTAAWAQAPKKQPAAAGKSSAPATRSQPGAPRATKTAPATKTPPAAAPQDSFGRQEVLQSKEWLDTIGEFNDWLKSQSMYDSDQVKRIHARLEAGISRMNASDLRRFMIDLQAKVKVLNSQQTSDAEDYLNEMLDVASPAYVRRMRQQLPDLLTGSPRQIKQQLSNFALRKESASKAQQVFDNSRRQQIAYNQAKIRARQEAQRADQEVAATTAPPSSATPATEYYPELGAEPVAAPFGAFQTDTYGGAAMW